jgi:Family of unknown function (DUF6011)
MPTLNQTLQPKVEQLQSLLQAFDNPRDRQFAASLCTQFWNRGDLTPKQMPWVDKLIAKATQPAAPARAQGATAIGDLASIVQLFGRTAGRLQKPSIVLLTDMEVVSTDNMIRIQLAGPASRNPGSLYVTWYESKVYLGLVTPQGEFRPKPGTASTEQLAKITAMLRLFAANPAEVAGVHGRLMGRCCFCRLGLDDPRSTAVGYGPICAGHYGLPWGETTAAPFVCTAE